MSDAGFFTWPNRTWNGTALFTESGLEDGFDFRVVECFAAKNGQLSVSLPSEQQIIVQNVNDPTQITAPPALPFSVLGLGALDDDTGTNEHNEDSQKEDVLKLSGWRILDVDKDVDPTLVHIRAFYGIVRLNQLYLSLADFTSLRCQKTRENNESSIAAVEGSSHLLSNCQGSGEDRFMAFVTTPGHLSLLLEGMEYRSIVTNVVDTVSVTIFDGKTQNGGQDGCLAMHAFNSTSLLNSCWVTTANLTVEVGTSALLSHLQFSNSKERLPVTLWFACGGGTLFIILAGSTFILMQRKTMSA
jgi:hypothetical protein